MPDMRSKLVPAGGGDIFGRRDNAFEELNIIVQMFVVDFAHETVLDNVFLAF